MCKVCLAIMGLATLAAAAPIDAAKSAEFSADAFEARPGSAVRSGRLYVRGSSRRFDYQVGGMPVAEIEIPEKGVRRVLFPLSRTYLEHPYTPAPETAPCAPGPGLSCAKSGGAEIDGIKTELWTMKLLPRGRETRVWWDATRRLALRAEHGDGTVMEAKRAADESYEDRKVERWQITYKLPGGRVFPAEALFDGTLGMSIAERRGDGGLRHLVNISVKPVDPAKFEVPAGFSKLPAGPGAASEVAGAAAAAAANHRDRPMPGAGTAAAVTAPPTVAPPAPKPAEPAAPSAAPPAKPGPAPEPARRVEAPSMTPVAETPTALSPAQSVAAPAATSPPSSVAARDEIAPPLPEQKPAASSAGAALAAAAAAAKAAAAVKTEAPAKSGASPKTKQTSNQKPAAKGKPNNGTVPNPSSIPTLGALPASGAGTTSAARTSGGAKKTGKAKSTGSTRSTKGRRKAR